MLRTDTLKIQEVIYVLRYTSVPTKPSL